jgi:allophanate hydrolase subunit 2
MISEGIPLGAIQFPPDGQPIVLLNDQTIGGYPRLGALTPLSLARLAQKLPGTAVRLKAVMQKMAHRGQVVFFAIARALTSSVAFVLRVYRKYWSG